MPKLRIVRLYKTDEVPDHLFQEVLDLVNKIGESLNECLKDEDPSIVLSAFNRFHACMIVSLITEKGLKDAAETEAIGLMKNVEHISGQKIWEEKE